MALATFVTTPEAVKSFSLSLLCHLIIESAVALSVIAPGGVGGEVCALSPSLHTLSFSSSGVSQVTFLSSIHSVEPLWHVYPPKTPFITQQI